MGKVGLALVQLAMAASALAGCSDGGGEAATDGLDGVDVKATATTGVVRGVVVDEAVRPLAGVEVTLRRPEGDLNQTTAAEGAFGFQGLAPGTYFLSAHLFGYADAQSSAEVEAGVDDPPVVRMLLTRIPGLVAFAEQHSWEGFLECGTQSTAFYANLCSLPNFSSGLACSLGAPCAGNVTNDSYLHALELAPGIHSLQSEMVWESTQSFGDAMELQHFADNRQEYEQQLINHTLNNSMGPSPVVVGEDAESLAGADVGTLNLLVLAVYPGYAPGEQAGFTVQQRFAIYTTVFYGYAPPAGWTFTATGEVPPPR